MAPRTAGPEVPASRQNLDLVRELHGLGLDPAARDGQGRTALHYAAGSSPETGHPEVLRALLDLGVPADPADDSGTTPLLLAAEAKSLEAVRALLAAGADPNARDEEGRAALVLARRDSEKELRSLLLQVGADPDLTDGRGRTVLHWLAPGGSEADLREVLAAGADLDARDEEGMTPMMFVARDLWVRRVEWMRREGADPDLKDHQGRTAGDHFWDAVDRELGGSGDVEAPAFGLRYSMPGPLGWGRPDDLVEGSARVHVGSPRAVHSDVHVVVARMTGRSELWRVLYRASGASVTPEMKAPVSLVLSESSSELTPSGNLIRAELIRGGNPNVSYTAEISTEDDGVLFVTASGAPEWEPMTRALLERVVRSLETSAGKGGGRASGALESAGGEPTPSGSLGQLLLWTAVALGVIGVAVWIGVARARSRPRFSVPDSYRPRPPR